MDNLAHSLFAVATTAAVAPRSLKKHPVRMILAGAVAANIPDIDIILGVFGQAHYHFHHRGFTHSFLGLPLMIPLAMLIQRLIGQKQVTLPLKQLFIWASAQILVTHMFLDYLTSYGVMLFYPATFDRFALPLMFIIDPVFWLIGILGVAVLMTQRHRKCRQYRILGCTILGAFASWWLLLGVAKQRSHQLSYPQSSEEEVMSFPGPLAPLLWLTVRQDTTGYDSKVLSFMSKHEAKILHQAIDDSYAQDQICPSHKPFEAAVDSFHRYKRWASWTVCKEDQVSEDCICHSMRYAFSFADNKTYFGSVRIQKDGQLNFIPPKRDDFSGDQFQRLIDF